MDIATAASETEFCTKHHGEFELYFAHAVTLIYIAESSIFDGAIYSILIITGLIHLLPLPVYKYCKTTLTSTEHCLYRSVDQRNHDYILHVADTYYNCLVVLT